MQNREALTFRLLPVPDRDICRDVVSGQGGAVDRTSSAIRSCRDHGCWPMANGMVDGRHQP